MIEDTHDVGDLLREHGDDVNFYLGDLLGDNDDESITTMPVSKYASGAQLTEHLESKSNQFIVLSLNVRSLADKHNLLSIFIDSLKRKGIKIAALCLQECFFGEKADEEQNLEKKPNTSLIELDDYELVPQATKVGRTGGLAIYIHESYRFKPRNPLCCLNEDWEMQFVDIFADSLKKPVTLGNIYRPPRNSADKIDGFISAMDSTLKKMGTPGKYQILCGDYNLNLLNVLQSEKINKYFELLVSEDFAPFITLPTRLDNNGACTLIDNIWVRSPPGCPTPMQHVSSRILTDKFSDHMACIVTLDIMSPTFKVPKTVTRRNYSEENMNKFCEDFEKEKVTEKIGPDLNCDPNLTYEVFHKSLTSIRDKHMPLITKKFDRKRDKINNWITPSIIKSVAKKNKLYVNFKKAKVGSVARENKKEKFKEYECVLNQVIRKAKTNYYTNQFERYVNDIKGTWREIKKLLNKNRRVSIYPTTFVRGGIAYTDPKDIANGFNEFFTGIGPQLAQGIDTSGKPAFSSYMGQPAPSNFLFNFTDVSKVKKIINNLTSKTSSGDDEVSSIFLKNEKVSNIFLPSLTILINQSLHTGIFPDRLKLAKVIPLYKDKGDDYDFENYRPISLLSVLSKIFERVVFDQIYDYFTENKLFYDSQYGFRKGHSTEQALLELFDRILKDVDSKKDPFAIFLDLSKAFDTIDHNILINKLNHYGINGTALNWFKSYLSNRCQYVAFNGINSDMLPISTGVPQGSILGPLLFIIYINDLSHATTLFKFICFADDSNLLGNLQNAAVMTPAGGGICHTTNGELQKVADWMAVNKLSLNASKTRLMVFMYRQRQTPATEIPVPLLPEADCNLYLNGEKIKKVREFNFLGVTINQCLSWKPHTNILAAKIGKNVGILTRLKQFVPVKILKMLYVSLILSRLNYGILAWGFDLGRLVVLQKKAIRAISKAKYNAHTEPLFKLHNLLKLEDIFTLRCLKFYYNLKNKMLPSYFYEMLPTAGEIHGIQTRQAGDLHRQRTTRTVGAENCIRNKILDEIVNYEPLVLDKVHTHSYQGFSNYAKNFIINSYELNCDKGLSCNTCHPPPRPPPEPDS